MPTVLHLRRLRVVIYPNDHRPAHVHVVGTKEEAVFFLNCPEGPPDLRESHGFKQSDLGRLAETLMSALRVLCSQWSAIHGDR